ncbi:clusterin-associated protein 1-like [Convolutriloba macropyga]|uniref:clusterin-associated protein 1-like n=1 Tax=Convolutriloba macropyga TaxID=536237 RepID=UPI003F523A4D
MSYRDLRNLTEMMRALNFPKHVSLESFRQPNFPMMAEMLKWLVLRYDQNAAIMDSIQKETDRVLFVKSIVQFLAVKAHLKLNIKRLYQSDRHAVKELIKVASLLYDAINISKSTAITSKSESDLGLDDVKRSDVSSKQTEIRKIRELSSLITEKGAVLYDLLEKEIELKRLRQDAINKPPDIDGIGRDIQKAIQSIDNEIGRTVKLLDNVATDEANLESKTANRHEELERLQKRLKSLGSVRPAFMDEYEAEEKKLEKLYTEYIIRFRNLTYLESQLEEFHQASQRDLEAFDHRVESAKKQSVFSTVTSGSGNGVHEGIEERSGGDAIDHMNDDSEDDEIEEGFQKRADRPGGASAVKKGAAGGAGSSSKMYGDDDDDEDSDEDEDDSDENEDDDDDEDEDLNNFGAEGSDDEEDDEEDDFAIERQRRPKARSGPKKGKSHSGDKRFNSSQPQDEDDDDNF